jgi:hypothetical protein
MRSSAYVFKKELVGKIETHRHIEHIDWVLINVFKK